MKKNAALNFVSRGNGRKCRHQATKEGSENLRSRALYFVTRDSGGKCQSAGLTKEGRTRDGVCRWTYLLYATVFSFALILLSLFTLNHSSIFNLSSPTAHAASSSTTDLSLDVPTMIALSIVKSNPQCTGDELDTSASAPPANAQLCLHLGASDVAGRQEVSVRTNNPYGYIISGHISELRCNGDRSQGVLIASCSLDDSKVCGRNVFELSDGEQTFDSYHQFGFALSASSDTFSAQRSGNYIGSIKYTATANTSIGTSLDLVDSDDRHVYNYSYTGAPQFFKVPQTDTYRLEVWGAGYCGTQGESNRRGCGGRRDDVIIVAGGGGGGGWYGGSGSPALIGGGGGGSGYIGSSRLTNKHMYGYDVQTSDDENTRTISGTCASSTPTSDCVRIGHGYARITYLGN